MFPRKFDISKTFTVLGKPPHGVVTYIEVPHTMISLKPQQASSTSPDQEPPSSLPSSHIKEIKSLSNLFFIKNHPVALITSSPVSHIRHIDIHPDLFFTKQHLIALIAPTR
jgi:hypothetical protein